MKKTVSAYLLALVSYAHSALTLSSQMPSIDIAYDKFTLDNGLTVVVHEDRKAPIVAISIWYHVGSKNEPAGIKLQIDEPPAIKTAPLPGATSKIKTETDDGFKTFNEIPVTPAAPPAPIRMSPEETLKEKLKLLRALEAMEKKGVQLTKKYTMDSPLAEMKGEYETIKSDAEKKSSVKFQRQMMLAAVSGLEFLNGRFDPFDLTLDGW